MPQKVSLQKAVGIAGKDTLAFALAAKGVDFLNSAQYVPAVICIGLAVGLLFVEQYFVD